MSKPCGFCQGTGFHPAVPFQADLSATTCPVCLGTMVELPHGQIALQHLIHANLSLKHAINFEIPSANAQETEMLLRTGKRFLQRLIYLAHIRGVNLRDIADQLGLGYDQPQAILASVEERKIINDD